MEKNSKSVVLTNDEITALLVALRDRKANKKKNGDCSFENEFMSVEEKLLKLYKSRFF
ncbi:MAG: hypothetical protein K6F35_08015 [Lachnospiraceae bacterium]|nr:hypothetical protein [Lachnospiraceae bacterium]